jgi:formylglycine-generating enzyme required for sulfatase activity
VQENDGPLIHRYLKDASGVTLFDNVVVRGQSECVFERDKDGLWTTPAKCALMPLDKITPAGAKAYCESIGRHVVTSDQWEFAARGHTNRIYPFGDKFKRPVCTLHSYDQFKLEPTAEYTPDVDAECATTDPGPRGVTEPTSDVTPEGVKFLLGNDTEITGTPFEDRDHPNDKFVEIRGASILSTREMGMTSWRGRMPGGDARAQTTTRCAE